LVMMTLLQVTREIILLPRHLKGYPLGIEQLPFNSLADWLFLVRMLLGDFRKSLKSHWFVWVMRFQRGKETWVDLITWAHAWPPSLFQQVVNNIPLKIPMQLTGECIPNLSVRLSQLGFQTTCGCSYQWANIEMGSWYCWVVTSITLAPQDLNEGVSQVLPILFFGCKAPIGSSQKIPEGHPWAFCGGLELILNTIVF
jgi:hypothetical protein